MNSIYLDCHPPAFHSIERPNAKKELEKFKEEILKCIIKQIGGNDDRTRVDRRTRETAT